MHFRTLAVLEDVGHLVGIIDTKRFPAHPNEDVRAEFLLVVEIAVLVVEVLVLHTVVVWAFVTVGETGHHTHMDTEVDFETAGVTVTDFNRNVAVDVRQPAAFVLDLD